MDDGKLHEIKSCEIVAYEFCFPNDLLKAIYIAGAKH